MTLMTRYAGLMFCTEMMILIPGVVASQEYPNKPIRIVTSAAGGGSDFAARIIAQGISSALGQPVLVENRGGIIGTEIVAKSSADGYTLLLSGSNIYISPLLQKMSYDVVREQLAAIMKSEMVRMGKVIKDAGIRSE